MRSNTITYIKLLLVFASYVKIIINKSKRSARISYNFEQFSNLKVKTNYIKIYELGPICSLPGALHANL